VRTLTTYHRLERIRTHTRALASFIGVLLFLLLITIYCLHITGRVVSVATVAKFIRCSLFSVGLDGYFHKITIRIDRSTLDIKGKNLRGLLQISIVTPYGAYISNYWIDDPKTICIDISKALQDFVKYYKNSLKSNYQDVPELTIWFTFYMYDNDGNLYIGSYGYDTFSLLMITGRSYIKAAEIAYNDPLQAFKHPLLIIVSRSEVNYINFTRLLKKILNRIMLRLYNTNLIDTIKNSRVKIETSIDHCKNIIMINIWNLTGASKRLSYAYLYLARSYSAYEALRCTMLMTGYAEGINIIKHLKSIENITENVPISIIFKCHSKYPIEALGELVEPPYARYISGLSFLGYIISGYYNIHSNLWVSKLSYASCNAPSLSFLIPVSFIHVANSVVVIYYMQKINIRGQDYWLVIPISSMVPIYFMRLEPANIRVTGGAYLINRSFMRYELIYETLLPTHTESSHKIFSECSACLPMNFSYFTYLACPLVHYLNQSFSSIEKIFSSLFYLTCFNTSPTSIAFLIGLTTYNYTTTNLRIRIYELTGRYQPYYPVNNSKYVPLISSYVVVVR